MVDGEDFPWEGQCADAAYAFALRCAELSAENPHGSAAPLNEIICDLMTELWDRNFSQTDIRAAFEAALRAMPLYGAGLEGRSPTSKKLGAADWLATDALKPR